MIQILLDTIQRRRRKTNEICMMIILSMNVSSLFSTNTSRHIPQKQQKERALNVKWQTTAAYICEYHRKEEQGSNDS